MHTTTRPDSLVCGVDDSPHATDVVAVAATLAERLGLRLRLVHSADPNVFLIGQPRRDALRRGEELLDVLGVNASAVDRVVDLGSPAGLLRAVIAEDAALAVVGTRGRGPGRAALLGSISHRLAGSSPCPVVIVPPGATTDIATAPTIVCGVDGSPGADAALHHGAELASALGGRLLAVHVRAEALTTPHATSLMPGPQPFTGSLDTAHTALAAVEHALEHLDVDIPIDTRIETGYAADRLAAVAAEESSAILVVGSPGPWGRPVGAAGLSLATTRRQRPGARHDRLLRGLTAGPSDAPRRGPRARFARRMTTAGSARAVAWPPSLSGASS